MKAACVKEDTSVLVSIETFTVLWVELDGKNDVEVNLYTLHVIVSV